MSEIDITKLKLPKHVAIVMDGNGRWARSRSLLRTRGHEQGANSTREVVTETRRLGISHLTLYTFSTENWRRDKTEVNFLMKLLERFMKSELQLMMDKDIRFTISGDRSLLPEGTLSKIEQTINHTKDNKSMTLNLALSYGGRQEILKAIKQVAREYKENQITDDELQNFSQDSFSKYLYTANMPDPDLMIRTGGEIRLSNFLLWQMAYTEFYFTRTLWPDFTIEEYRHAIEQFATRERRFGKEKSSKKGS